MYQRDSSGLKGELVHKHLGNTESITKKDAKYRIRHGNDGEWQVEIIYYIGKNKYQRPATKEHPELIRIVNDAKAGSGGIFYIDEFRHVLIPSNDGAIYCVGKYDALLEFIVDGFTVSAEPPITLPPGGPWTGPHTGRRYRVKADASDIYYRATTDGVTDELFLSDFTGPDAAAQLARRLCKVKGPQGGRIYINERKQFFAPVDDEFLYLGPLGNDLWFPEPECS